MKLNAIKYLLIPAVAVCFIASCRPDNPVPKRRGYPRYDFPEHAYRQFDSASFPFSFEYPVYGQLEQDQNLNKEEHSPYWINVTFKELNATIYLSYKDINSANPLDKLIEESYKLTQKHDVKADRIDAPPIVTRNGLKGVFYMVGGNAASAYQFFLTDETKHFIRGALYFNTTPNADSLMPANDFLKKDMEHLVETLQFR
jgi:gliding motility-associated lipoprotein GldD